MSTLIIQGTADKAVPVAASSRVAAWPPGRLAAQDITDSMRVECGEAPHGLFATHRQRLNENPLDFIGR